MAKKLSLSFDSDLIESISADFDLRNPNKEALRKLIFTLGGSYDPGVMQVMNLATGVGKTYLMAAFIEYLRQQGIGSVVIVTPGKIIQSKTIQNFTPGNLRYIAGSQVPPDIVTPQDYSAWITRINGEPGFLFGSEIPMLVFIFNIQQLIAPKKAVGDTHDSTQDAERRKPRCFDENAGVLFEYLKGIEGLVVIADESHLYSSSAAAFRAALKELDPAACIGLTASVLPGDKIIYKYPLYRAIQDKYVKSPVLAFRKGGYGKNRASEEQQLRDALQLRELKQSYYDAYTTQMGKEHLNAVVFVVCADVEHATQVANLLRTPEYLGHELSVLQVDSKHENEITQRFLENLDRSDSPVLAVVSVNKLKEGWDVRNIAVIVTLRSMASEVLTQQTMGRGLRLPFGKYTGVWQIDQLDIIAHQSFQELLAAENVLKQFGLDEAVPQTDMEKMTDTIRKAAEQAGDNSLKGSFRIETSSDVQDSSQLLQQGDISSGCSERFHNNICAGNEDKNLNAKENLLEKIGTSIVGIRTIDSDGIDNTADSVLSPVVIERNPRFANVSYKFPVTVVKMEQPPIELSEIADKEIEEAAKKVISTGDVLYRKEIIAALGKKIRVADAESAEVDSIRVADSDAANVLIKLVVNMQLVPATSSVIRYVENYLVQHCGINSEKNSFLFSILGA